MESLLIPEAIQRDPLLLKSIVSELTICSIAVYLILSIYCLHKTSISEHHDKNKMKLINFLWFIIGSCAIILISIIVIKILFPADLGEYVFVSMISLFIYSLSFKIIRDSVFFQKREFERKYRKSVLDGESKDHILTKIIHVMETEKYYLNSSASLPEFARKINQSPNHVSQVINECLNLTFFGLLAKYRIEESKRIMKDPTRKAQTIEGIAYDVGYNSKSSFNKAFKSITGITPSEFLRNTQ